MEQVYITRTLSSIGHLVPPEVTIPAEVRLTVAGSYRASPPFPKSAQDQNDELRPIVSGQHISQLFAVRLFWYQISGIYLR